MFGALSGGFDDGDVVSNIAAETIFSRVAAATPAARDENAVFAVRDSSRTAIERFPVHMLASAITEFPGRPSLTVVLSFGHGQETVPAAGDPDADASETWATFPALAIWGETFDISLFAGISAVLAVMQGHAAPMRFGASVVVACRRAVTVR